ncbi:MAG TPA: divalent-cation tolerance protein CutA [Pseudonocardiaceae bacterium]|jgi:periplasmic divalent cation tolerance protein|nr:divalent-cation tolerance protein CutA [Pseudonocardiaceae bacterium]
MTEPTHCLVLTTVDSAAAADRLATAVVSARAAACAQVVGPMRSTYRWEGALTTDEEWQVVMKTTVDAVDRLTEQITAHHTYDLPEILAVPVLGGAAAYLRWVTDETRAP